jgi:serine/threonine protein kinase
MHSLDYIHRDIKPENFLIGNSPKVGTIYAIDFGLSKRFVNPKTGEHIEHKKTNFAGTARYCSKNAHNKYQQSRKDDLEAIGNILVYFYNKGHLPWMIAEGSEHYGSPRKLKNKTNTDTLCKDVPYAIQAFMTHVDSLKF